MSPYGRRRIELPEDKSGMNCVERVGLAIQHREADKVPKGELEVEKSLRGKLLAEDTTGDDFEDEIRVRKLLNMDIAPLAYLDRPPNRIVEEKGNGQVMTEDIWGNQYAAGKDTSKQVARAIREVGEIRRYRFPDLEKFQKNTIERWVNETNLFVFAQLDGGYNGVYPFFGLTEFLMYSQTNPEEIKYFVNKTIDYWIELAKKILEAKPDAILIGDDMAYNSGTMMSPASLRELVFPAMKREVEALKRMSGRIPVFLHSDGNLNEVMDDIIDMGFDGLHSLQPSADMNIEKIKMRYGDRLCLMGNLDLDHLLPYGKPEEIEEKVKWLIEVAAQNGGFILSTCNVLTKDIPPVNALAMYQAAEKHGGYK